MGLNGHLSFDTYILANLIPMTLIGGQCCSPEHILQTQHQVSVILLSEQMSFKDFNIFDPLT